MKNGKIGKIDVSELNAPPEKHEYETAKYFANRGYNVTFIKPSDIKGARTPDFMMDGMGWETKSPIRYSNSTFEFNFKKAVKQSLYIIFDLRRLSKSDEKLYIVNIKKRAITSKAKIIVIITKDGQKIDIKGKF